MDDKRNQPRLVGLQVSCPRADTIDHAKDDGFVQHGTEATPVVVEETRERMYVHWEYDRIGQTLGHCHRCGQELLYDVKKPEAERRWIDRIVMREANGTHHVFYFDVTTACEAGKTELERAYEDMKAGKPVDPKLAKLLEQAMKFKGGG